MKTMILFATLLLTAASSYAGGFWLEFGNPSAAKDPKARNAAVLVRALGCHNPEAATYVGTAEGVVNGVRQSVPLKFSRLNEKGLWAVERGWPGEGKWVLHIEARNNGLSAHALGKVEPEGSVKRLGDTHMFKVSRAEIESALE